MKKYLVEFIGTFFWALTFVTAGVYGAGAVDGGAGALNLAPLAVGLVLMAMYYACGHVSGAHFNPAVTLAALLRGRCEGKEVLPYVAAQLLAALVGTTAASILVTTRAVEPRVLASAPTLLAEFLFTFALVFVVLNTMTARANSGNSFYGLAVGAIVTGGGLVVGGVSGASFNPAVSLSLCMAGQLAWVDLWMHLLPQLVAAIAAAYTFLAVCPEDR